MGVLRAKSSGFGFCAPLFGATASGGTVVVEVREEDADVGSAALGHRQDQARPRRRARLVAGILQVDQVREFGGDDHVECAVAVDVGDGRILGGGGIGALGQRHVVPPMGIGTGEGDPHVPLGRTGVLGVGLVHGDDVLEAVAVEVAHHEAVATGEWDAA